MKFNISNYVRVRLTDHGRQIHKQNTEAYGLGGVYYRPPVEDDQGWSKWQLWDLMSVFGHSISLGCELPFDTTIEICSPPSSENDYNHD